MKSAGFDLSPVERCPLAARSGSPSTREAPYAAPDGGGWWRSPARCPRGPRCVHRGAGAGGTKGEPAVRLMLRRPPPPRDRASGDRGRRPSAGHTRGRQPRRPAVHGARIAEHAFQRGDGGPWARRNAGRLHHGPEIRPSGQGGWEARKRGSRALSPPVQDHGPLRSGTGHELRAPSVPLAPRSSGCRGWPPTVRPADHHGLRTSDEGDPRWKPMGRRPRTRGRPADRTRENGTRQVTRGGQCAGRTGPRPSPERLSTPRWLPPGMTPGVGGQSPAHPPNGGFSGCRRPRGDGLPASPSARGMPRSGPPAGSCGLEGFDAPSVGLFDILETRRRETGGALRSRPSGQARLTHGMSSLACCGRAGLW